MNSMTGFGSKEIVDSTGKLQVTIKSVNHKNLDIRIKGLAEEPALEEMVKSSIAKRAVRGHFEVFVQMEGEKESGLLFNPEAYDFYEQLLRNKGASHPAETAWILEQPGVVIHREDDVKKLDEALLMKAFQPAFDDLCRMRENEGANLRVVLMKHIDGLNGYVRRMQEVSIEEKKQEKKAFEARIEEVMGTYEVDLPRFSTELALLYEKIAFEEEIARLISHINQFNVIMNDKGSVGRRLDFLLQEMFREANTIASKSRHIGILHDIVEVKTLIDHLREQVANIE